MNDIVPYKIDDEQFGKLIDLPKIYQDTKNSVAAAKLATDKYLKPFKDIPDLTKADLALVEAVVAPTRILRTKLAATKKLRNELRAPLTRKMADITSALVAEENLLDDLIQECKQADDKLQVEIARRNKVASDAAAKKITDANAKTDRITKITMSINTTFGGDLAKKVADMHTKFYSFTASVDLYNWMQQMKKFVPTYTGADVTRDIVGDPAEILEVRAKLLPTLTTEWVSRLALERDHLVDLLAGRMEELVNGTPTAVVVSVDNFASSVMATVNHMNEEAQDASTKEKLDTTFDHTVTVPFLSAGAKGKTAKKKYLCQSIEALQTIMQSWVKFNMTSLSIDELNKKLSFMRTAADARLNAGHPVLEAKGLSVVEDISTRTQKQTPDA